MANKTHETKTRGETRTGIEGKDVSPNQAGAHGAPQGEMRTDTASGLSGDKGVQSVGDPSMPTGMATGLRVGEPGEQGVSDERSSHTLQAQLTGHGLAEPGSEGDQQERQLPEAERLMSEDALPAAGDASGDDDA